MTNQLAWDEERRELMKGHGIFLMLEVEHVLKEMGIICCVMGQHASRYYGVHTTTADWEVCVPDDKFTEAADLFECLDHMYEPAPEIMPQLDSLIHTWPRFQPIESNEGINMTFWIMPAFEWLPDGLEEAVIERSRKSNLPFPRLEPFAQSLVVTQRWTDLMDLVDGMDLSEQWGYDNLSLGQPSESDIKYAQAKNQQYRESFEGRPQEDTGGLIWEGAFDRTKRWQGIVRNKERRIKDIYGMKQRYITKYRRKGSGDPRENKNRVL